MTAPLFPFAALVGLEPLQMALQLAAVDPQLSVLARGDKGAGKSTASRALGALLAAGAPFVNVPIGATEDRLLGGLDIERAMRGEPALKQGLVAAAHGGVLYIDEVNLLPDHLADALLDTVSSGIHVVEREGFSVVQETRFVLIGSMNPDEGALRPQLLDRFALSVDVSAPMEPAPRRLVVERRLAFDEDPAGFSNAWIRQQEALRRRIDGARRRLLATGCDAARLDEIALAVCGQGVRSLRADLAAVRASRALAALEAADTVTSAHVAAVLPLVLGHRAATRPPSAPPAAPPPPPPPLLPDGETPESASGPGSAAQERVFGASQLAGPAIMAAPAGADPGRVTARESPPRGAVIGSRSAERPGELDVRATFARALVHTGLPRPRTEDLVEKVRAHLTDRRFLFIVDSSGSQAIQQRMRFVKGAVLSMLERSATRRDEVVVIAFRGTSAEVILPPTRDLVEARAALGYLPTGGRTPLAHGLELAAGYVTDSTVVVLVTDGRANVASRSDDPLNDALLAAAAIRCPAIVIDSETGAEAAGGARRLAEAMGATYMRLDELGDVATL